MKATVILPVRNDGDKVATTMESLLAQTRAPDEIIVADGCSTDDTVDRVLEWADRLPIRVVENETRFAGGGRNAATRAAAHDLIVAMDMGNRAHPRWLEAMIEPFEADPDLEYVGGIYYPILETWFERLSGAIIYFEDCIGMTWSLDELKRRAPSSPLPGGMSMAYRRRVFERAGGCAEWAKKSQDRLFSLRIQRIGAKIGIAFESIMYHHMAGSLSEVWSRHYNYGIWGARTALPRGRFRRLSLVYGGGLVLLLASIPFPWLLLVLLPGAAAYTWVGAFGKLRQLARATGQSFSLKQVLWAPIVLFVRDAAVILGGIRGTLDRALDPSWRKRTSEYLEHGRQEPF